MSLTATTYTETSKSGPETRLCVTDSLSGEVLASGPIGYLDCAPPAPESVTAEDVRRYLRISGLAHLADLPLVFIVSSTRTST